MVPAYRPIFRRSAPLGQLAAEIAIKDSSRAELPFLLGQTLPTPAALVQIDVRCYSQ